MTQHSRTKSDIRDGIDRTAGAVAAGHDAFLHEASRASAGNGEACSGG